MRKQHGAAVLPRRMSDMISEISSSVPTPPGRATNASPSSIIFALRSGIDSTTNSSVRSHCATPASTKKRGSTPYARPPASITVRATIPISPMELPPYTSACPCDPIHAPSSCAASTNRGSAPLLDPQYTVMFIAPPPYRCVIGLRPWPG